LENLVFLVVLFAALSHAGWNALIKVGLDPLSTTTLISIGSGVVAVALLPLVGLPALAAWPWLLASVVIHLVYFASLIESYRTGDLGQVYPIARGSAPLLTATATTIFVGEKLSLVGWTGIATLVAGVFLLSARGGRELTKINRRAVGFAFITALTICTYSVVDGIGVRLAGNPGAYTMWMFVGIAVVMLPYALIRDGHEVVPAMRLYWRRGFAGSALQVLSYGMVLWAMTVAPIAIVATLRETSVLFGAGIAVIVLKEPLRAVRIGAALLIVCGMVLIRLQ
jgi:drug/metabolite transporter (DMT)-like permease